MMEKIHMDKIKGTVVLISTVIGNELGMICPALVLLMFLMIADYVSGMLASKKEAAEHPNNKRYGWSSQKSIIGIYKKFGYILTVFVAISTDYVIYALLGEMGIEYQMKTTFGFIVTIWLVINEMLSLLENAGRMGVKLPKFLLDILAEMKKDIDEHNEK